MAIKKLSEILGSRKGLDLEFTDLQVDETSKGEPLVRLILKTPIGNVIGRLVTDPVTKQQGRLEASDVETVSIGKSTLDAIEDMETAGTQVFFWDEEGKSGRIVANLRMDVSAALEVWIAAESFAAFGNRRRTEIRNERQSALVKRINDSKTKKEFAGTDVTNTGTGKPEPVAEKTA